MSRAAWSAPRSGNATDFALGTLIGLYAVSRVLQLFAGRVPTLAVVAFHVIPAALFALLHGALRYRLSGILAFFTICLLVAGISENVGVWTGYPFGRYYFTDLMGPKILVVPVFLALAYVGMGYISWTLGRIIIGDASLPLTRQMIVTVPLVASFLMVAWDMAMDPVWSTVMNAWIWLDGGPYFGVPISNFFGWYLINFVIYVVFALYLRRRSDLSAHLPSQYWFSAVLFYAISAGGNILLLIPRPGPRVVFDPAGVQWRVADITANAAVISVFTMGGFALIAGLRVFDRKTR
jgi:uncharacterized membrane protein